MCFYTQQNAPAKNVKQRFNAEIDNEENFLQSDYINGFSHPNIPIVLDLDPKKIRTDFSWGLIPHWSINDEIKKNTLNARIETIKEKRSFMDITTQRCLIIATGYYEWHWNDSKGKSKDKYQINSQDDEIFTFAGLYERWVNPENGELKYTYTMVTTEANETMKYVHNHKMRMPIMLKRNDESAWLDNTINISEFAYPYEADLIATQLNKTNYELF